MVEVEITDLGARGDGVGRQIDGAHAGRVVFVPDTVPGDRVRVVVVRERRDHARGRVEEILRAGPGRAELRCIHVDECGGCAWQHADGETQNRARVHRMRRELERLATRTGGEAPTVEEVRSPARFRWRSRLRLRFDCDGTGRGARIGMYARASRKLVDLGECPVATEPLERAMEAVRDVLSPRPLRARGSVVLTGGDEDGVVASLHTRGRDLPAEAVASALVASGGVHGAAVRAGRAEATAGRPFVSRTQPVAGRAIIIEHPAEGFAQANLDIARTLAAAVGAEVERLAPGGRVLELFSGCGWLTAAAAQRGRSVVAVECHAVSVAALRRNVVRHDLSVEVLERSAFGAADELLRDEPACVVLDPPREGALQITRAIAHHASAAGPGVLYVSCDLATLLRDVAPLLEAGMSLERATIFEMFPHTPHAEYVVALRPPDVHGKTC